MKNCVSSESLNMINGSLQVLQQLVTKFVSQNHVPLGLSHSHSNVQNFETIFQRLYSQLTSVFEWVEQQNFGSCEDFGENSQQVSMWKKSEDEELYQILNEYKQKITNLKQTVKQQFQKIQNLSSNLVELQIKKEKIDNENILINQKFKQLFKAHQELIKEKQQLDESNEYKEHRIESLQKNLEKQQKENKEQRIKNQQFQKLIMQLQQKFNSSQSQRFQLEKNYAVLSTQQTNLIQRKIQSIPMLVQQQLKDQRIWNKSSSELLKKYIRYTNNLQNKENI